MLECKQQQEKNSLKRGLIFLMQNIIYIFSFDFGVKIDPARWDILTLNYLEKRELACLLRQRVKGQIESEHSQRSACAAAISHTNLNVSK